MHSLRNTAVTTIKNCEDEPIRIPGAIQPHGFLLGISRTDGTIAYCSANVAEWLPAGAAGLLGKDTTALPTSLQDVLAASDPQNTGNKPHQATIGDKRFDVFVIHGSSYTLLECIATNAAGSMAYDILEHSATLVQRLHSDIGLQGLSQLVAGQIQAITGFDRVMIYRFDEEYNGEVFAEAVTPGTERFLGLHYPSTDIPKQARDLYMQNLMRLIADVDAEVAPIVTYKQELADAAMLDLSEVKLRAVSPIHIQYLKNMGVKATFTISLISDGRLWGLVACHHLKPCNLAFVRQLQAFVQAQILSSQIVAQVNAENYRLSKQLEAPLKTLQKALHINDNFLKDVFQHNPAVLQVANASAACFLCDDCLYQQGPLPVKEEVMNLLHWLKSKDLTEFTTDCLSDLFHDAAEYRSQVSGIYYQKVMCGNTWGHLLFVRPAANKVVYWAGKPGEKTTDATGVLTPRASFAAWKQLYDRTSKPWQEPEVGAAGRFAHALEQHLYQIHLFKEERKQRHLNERLRTANRELENIHWISAHDLKEPLRKIQVFASLASNPEQRVDVQLMQKSIERIYSSATRMRTLIDDLMYYARMSHMGEAVALCDLNDVMRDAMRSFEDERDHIKIVSETLPSVWGIRFQLLQLFVNLVGNSFKFRKPGKEAHILLRYEELTKEFPVAPGVRKWHKVCIADSGIGFEHEFADKIFDIFKRVHKHDAIEGNGVGLSICKKIMENHGGFIRAEGRQGEGATFFLYFPVEKPVEVSE